MQVLLGFLFVTYLAAIRGANRSSPSRPLLLLGMTILVAVALSARRFI